MKKIISYWIFLISRHLCEQIEGKGAVMLCCSGYYPNSTLHFEAYGSGLLPGERPRCPTENDICCVSQNKCASEMGFTSDTKCADVSPKPRLRQRTTEK